MTRKKSENLHGFKSEKSRDNYYDSVAKWINIINDVESFMEEGHIKDSRKEDYLHDFVVVPCGFCKEFDDGISCDGCPLYQTGHCSECMSDDETFWDFVIAFRDSNYHKAITHAKTMLHAIQSFEHLFKKKVKGK